MADGEYSDDFLSEGEEVARTAPRKRASKTRDTVPRKYGETGSKPAVAMTLGKDHRVHINELTNRLHEREQEIEQLRREIKTMTSIQRRQEKAINKYEGADSELAQVIARRDEEIRALQEQVRAAKQETAQHIEEKKKKDKHIEVVRKKHRELEEIVSDKGLRDIKAAQDRVRELEAQLEERSAQVARLEKMMQLEEKQRTRQQQQAHRQRSDTDELVAQLQDKVAYLMEKLEEKDKQIQAMNIRAHRLGGKDAQEQPGATFASTITRSPSKLSHSQEGGRSSTIAPVATSTSAAEASSLPATIESSSPVKKAQPTPAARPEAPVSSTDEDARRKAREVDEEEESERKRKLRREAEEREAEEREKLRQQDNLRRREREEEHKRFEREEAERKERERQAEVRRQEDEERRRKEEEAVARAREEEEKRRREETERHQREREEARRKQEEEERRMKEEQEAQRAKEQEAARLKAQEARQKKDELLARLRAIESGSAPAPAAEIEKPTPSRTEETSKAASKPLWLQEETKKEAESKEEKPRARRGGEVPDSILNMHKGLPARPDLLEEFRDQNSAGNKGGRTPKRNEVGPANAAPSASLLDFTPSDPASRRRGQPASTTGASASLPWETKSPAPASVAATAASTTTSLPWEKPAAAVPVAAPSSTTTNSTTNSNSNSNSNSKASSKLPWEADSGDTDEIVVRRSSRPAEKKEEGGSSGYTPSFGAPQGGRARGSGGAAGVVKGPSAGSSALPWMSSPQPGAHAAGGAVAGRRANNLGASSLMEDDGLESIAI